MRALKVSCIIVSQQNPAGFALLYDFFTEMYCHNTLFLPKAARCVLQTCCREITALQFEQILSRLANRIHVCTMP